MAKSNLATNFKNHIGPRFSSLLMKLLLALLLVINPATLSVFNVGSSSALADDDDGDEDDAGGGNNGGDSGTSSDSNGNNGSAGSRSSDSLKKEKSRNRKKFAQAKKSVQQRQTTKSQPRPQSTPQQQDVLEENAPREIIALGLTSVALLNLEAQGYGIIQRTVLRSLGSVMVRFSQPEARSLAEARNDFAALGAGIIADFNHFYRSNEAADDTAASSAQTEAQCEGVHCAPMLQISWPLAGNAPKACAKGTVIGMVDAGINSEHEAFAGQSLERLRISMPGEQQSGLQHGTAVAALLIGGQKTRTPGLLASAKLVAIDTFHRKNGDERADVFSIATALDTLQNRGVDLINMSLAGPPNKVLEKLVESFSAKGIIIVAAAGNDGPKAPPAFPAAYPSVVAVTAIDAKRRIYRRANQGAHIDFAAPGVDIWTAASIKGAKRHTGTSFAAPFVTAAIAAAKASMPTAKQMELVTGLQRAAIDLGTSGFDTVFGNGLVQTATFCADVR